ncbi:P-loop containing nucleoside triphosphate hydrolase protein [Globomyces pollinis-pini]|nr:P-loop containing nucleoside triphosphate hydrolase protein [Globomyces pollinis-pini]
MDTNIRVVCRFRPQNKREINEGGIYSVEFDDEMTSVKSNSKEATGNFNFDKVFDWNNSQLDIFSYSAESIVNDIMDGYNGTIFAYGQTGSGKTHTMMGDMESEELKGLTPRIVEKIFTTIVNSSSDLEFTVKVQFMEIYMEKIKDLLNPINDNLPIHEDKAKGVYVKGILDVFVGSVEEVYEAMRRGQDARVVGTTNMNAESSRSHSIFVLQITQKNMITGSVKTGKLSLVDLAGSEKVGKTGATGQTLEEAKKINKSLSALGMVINALTDGKSSHIPYRDSKLTRILQESLGGNSRTTLIINCSPSSFNESETVSTLRFGMRAKSIKNKAKINTELSPAELKSLLRKVKSNVVELETQITELSKELVQWRNGKQVNPTDWVPIASDLMHVGDTATPTLLEDSRPSTPVVINKDEKEDFMRRENELEDQIAEREKELKTQKSVVESLTEELNFLKQRDSELSQSNKELSGNMNELNLRMEKILFESKEANINLDTLKDAKAELEVQVESLKKQIVNLQNTVIEDAVDDSDKQEKKKEKMAQMMREFDPTAIMDEKDKHIRDTMVRLAHINENSKPPSDPEAIASQHLELLEAKTKMVQDSLTIENLEIKLTESQKDIQTLKSRKESLETKLTALEAEYEQLLEKTIQEEEAVAGGEFSNVIHDLKSKLELQYNTKRDIQEAEHIELASELEKKEEEIIRLNHLISEGQMKIEELQQDLESAQKINGDTPETDQEVEKMRKTMATQLLEFDAMKKKLMRDLQNRCEKVVELELSLDETREQYNQILRNSNSRTQQQKMAFLERNLQQLTNVQKQLVDQNTNLKKDIVVCERKLLTRNERIQNLETLLNDAQNKLEHQNQRHEEQLSNLRAKLKESQAQHQYTPWIQSSRIAKPLRGGAHGAQSISDQDQQLESEPVEPPNPFNPDLTMSPSLSKKRSSWYVSLLKK